MTTDLCIAINGPHVDQLLRIFFGTMLRYITSDSFVARQLKIHVVVTESYHERADPRVNMEIVRGWIHKFHPIPLRVVTPDLPTAVHSQNEKDITKYVATNTALVCEWMLEHCGTGEYAIISHFDLCFTAKNLLRWMIEKADADPGIGQIGAHDPIVLYRRKAYRQTYVGFRDLSGLRAYPMPDRPGEYRIVMPATIQEDRSPYETQAGLPIHGWDVGELLALNIRYCGWRVVPAAEMIREMVVHIRSGSGYHGKSTDHIVENVASMIIEREGL